MADHNGLISYESAQKYWGSIEPTVNGMLGGFEVLTDTDCASSLTFISEYGPGGVNARFTPSPNSIACDCGAGIGRVSKHFLLNAFDKVDLVEQNPTFLQEAEQSYMGELKDRVENYFPVGLQKFNPKEGRYDLIWCQWVLGHLTDDDFVAFFKRCKEGLKPNGLIGIKENVNPRTVEYDQEDSSVTRPDSELKRLLGLAGLTIIKEETQQGFPKGLFPVKMYLLQ